MNEVKTQLILQAERWGRTDYYTPIKLEEMEREQCQRIAGELLSEKANLEYELHMLETDKHEVLIKIERLNVYLKKATQVVKKHEKSIGRIIEAKIGDRAKIRRATSMLEPRSFVSVLISEN